MTVDGLCVIKDNTIYSAATMAYDPEDRVNPVRTAYVELKILAPFAKLFAYLSGINAFVQEHVNDPEDVFLDGLRRTKMNLLNLLEEDTGI